MKKNRDGEWGDGERESRAMPREVSEDVRFRVKGLGFRVQGSGFRVQSLGFRV